MTKEDISELITSFKEANKSLRKRAITLGILMLLSISLTYMESYRLENVLELSNYQYRLDNIADLDTAAFKKVIDGENEKYFPIMDRCMVCLEHIDLFRNIQLNHYDRKILTDAIVAINGRIDNLNAQKAFGIAGFSIPIDATAYVFFLFMLVLFHDFVLVILYRDRLYRIIRRLKVPDWKLGFELFGYYAPTTDKSANKFAGFVSTLITSLFIFAPFFTCLLMMNQNTRVQNTLLIALNTSCLSFIITDTLIVFYNRSRRFRYWSNYLLGNYNVPYEKLQQIWVSTAVVLGVYFFLDAFIDTEADIDTRIAFFMMDSIPFVGLYLVMVSYYHNRTKFWRGARSALLIFCSVWFLGIITRDPENQYTFSNLSDMIGASIFVLVVSSFIAFLYLRFFLVEKKRVISVSNNEKTPETKE